MGDLSTSVSVVIPSTGRQELAQAISSVRAQDYSGDMEIIVVFDLDEALTPPEVVRLADAADRVIFTGGGRKGGAARNLGVQDASGTWVAFLDDDDAWMPHKLTSQLRIAALELSHGNSPVVGCRVEQVFKGDSKTHVVGGIPSRLIAEDEPIAEYLFLKRRPGAKRSSFFTSTVVAERWLCESVKWDESLDRHQDWDWLIRVGLVPSVSFRQAERDLVSINVGSPGSISAGANWEGSLRWARRVLEPIGTRVFVDFLLAQTLRYALQKRDFSGVRLVLRSVITARRFPGIGPTIIGASGLMPRVTLENLMRCIK
ncbi:glycosyltransferase family A protein [Arthrobacter sp. UYEF21]|uniref:glycosyltransferase family A protein n=1 Tax=Arthrobacter sp. UYEF21 TaxID=1756364 RepID=UPI003390EEA8